MVVTRVGTAAVVGVVLASPRAGLYLFGCFIACVSVRLSVSPPVAVFARLLCAQTDALPPLVRPFDTLSTTSPFPLRYPWPLFSLLFSLALALFFLTVEKEGREGVGGSACEGMRELGREGRGGGEWKGGAVRGFESQGEQ